MNFLDIHTFQYQNLNSVIMYKWSIKPLSNVYLTVIPVVKVSSASFQRTTFKHLFSAVRFWCLFWSPLLFTIGTMSIWSLSWQHFTRPTAGIVRSMSKNWRVLSKCVLQEAFHTMCSLLLATTCIFMKAS